MIANKETKYTTNASKKQLLVVREFDAPVEEVYKAWTTADLLEKWWAPKPWKAVNVSMDFREGGKWFYYMQGPEGERHYCTASYTSIQTNKSISWKDAFTDEKGTVQEGMPTGDWTCVFSKSGDGTKVECTVTCESEEVLNQFIEMGFKEGFAAAHQNLDALLAK